MWVFGSTTVVVLLAGCFDKPAFVGARDSGPQDGRMDGPPLPACAWDQIAEIRTYLPLDEPPGAPAVVDMSTATNNGTPTGATLGNNGKRGTAAGFADGADARVQLDSVDAFDSLTALTVCAWVWLDRLPTSTELSSNIVDKSLDGYDGWNMYVEVADGPRIGFLTPFGHYVAGQAVVATNEWAHVCVSWDGSDGPGGIALYRNGVGDPIELTNSLGKTGRDDDVPYPLVLGRSSITPPKYNLFGKLDEFFLYEAVVSPEAIKSLYQCVP